MKNSLGGSVNPNWTLCAHTKLQIQFLQLQKSSLFCWLLHQFHVTYTSSLTQHKPRENGEGTGRDCGKREALSQDASVNSRKTKGAQTGEKGKKPVRSRDVELLPHGPWWVEEEIPLQRACHGRPVEESEDTPHCQNCGSIHAWMNALADL